MEGLNSTEVTSRKQFVSDSRFLLKTSWHEDRVNFILFVLAASALSLIPFVQVQALSLLAQGLTDSDTKLIVAGSMTIIITISLVSPLSTYRDICKERNQLATCAAMQAELNTVVSSIPAKTLADPRVSARVEAHSRAVIDAVSPILCDMILGLTGVVSMLALVAVLCSLEPIAGLLVLLLLIPSIFAGRRVGRAVNRMWNLLGPIYQRDRYLRSVLSRQSSLMELSSLGTTDRITELAAAEQVKLVATRKTPLQVLLHSTFTVGLIDMALIGAAFGLVLANHAQDYRLIPSVYALISAVQGTSVAASFLTNALEFWPQTSSFREFLETYGSHAPREMTSRKLRGERLQVDHLSYSYEQGKQTLNDISFVASIGEITAIVGANGAGKSTTVHAIMGLLDVPEGTIQLDRTDVTAMDIVEWKSYFGLLSQDFGRYEVTVREAVSLGSPLDKGDSAIWEALHKADAEKFVKQLGDGLDSMLGSSWSGTELSGGQWQRLALARIYYRDAPVWILDEPTSAVDAATEQSIFEDLHMHKQNRIAIVVTHRASTLVNVDKIYVLESGRVVESGTYRELYAAHGTFYELFRSQLDPRIGSD